MGSRNLILIDDDSCLALGLEVGDRSLFYQLYEEGLFQKTQIRFRLCSQGSQNPSEASGRETILLLESFQKQNKARTVLVAASVCVETDWEQNLSSKEGR